MLKQDQSLGVPLADKTLRDIERALEGRLRAHHISESFIARCEDDAIQKAFAEYLRAVAEGREIENRDAFIVDVAFKRAVDEIRAETRHGDPATLAQMVDRSGGPAPAAEEEATDHLLAVELHEAMDDLSTEKRQALRLYYFEEKTIRECAELLYVSETGFRRVLRSAVATLRRRLGVEIPGPETPLGIEIGLAAWVATAGGLTPMTSGLVDHLIAVAAQLRRGLGAALDKLRELSWRAPPDSESGLVRALVTSPAGRVAGVCAGVAACAIGGAAIETSGPSSQTTTRPPAIPPAKRVAEQPTAPPRQATRSPRVSTAAEDEQQPPASESASAQKSADRAAADVKPAATRHTKDRSTAAQETEQVREQTSGIARVESESAGSSPAPESTEAAPPAVSEPSASTTTSSSSSSSSPARSSEEARVQEQFGAFK